MRPQRQLNRTSSFFNRTNLQQQSLKLLVLFMLLLHSACSSTEEDPDIIEPIDILAQIQALDIVSVSELTKADHFNRIFEVRIEQPVDHRNPTGPVFVQKVYLGHVGETLPVVFETEGYARSSHRTRELAPILGANQLAVEHRYFGESVPNPRDWQYLDIWQAANDLHRVVEIFKSIYTTSWVSSGASKGGDTAIFHRRFFPQDVDATVAYVAPILFAQQDQRFLDYFENSGDETCRGKMRTFQRNILSKLDSIPAIFDRYIVETGGTGPVFTFSLGYENIVYHATREDYWFEFWSSKTENCLTVPDENANAEELFQHFYNVFDVFLFFSDWGEDFWTPYVYQALTELGNYAYDVSHLEDLEMDIPPLVTYNSPTDFDPSVMQDIQDWIRDEASEMIFIYGEEDPWTVAAVDHPGSDSVIKIVHPGTKHGTRLATLTTANRNLILSKLTEWMAD